MPEALRHPREHRAMRFDDNEAARPGNRRVVRGHVVQIQPQEIPQCQRIGRAPGDPALGVDAFEVANQPPASEGIRGLPGFDDVPALPREIDAPGLDDAA